MGELNGGQPPDAAGEGQSEPSPDAVRGHPSGDGPPRPDAYDPLASWDLDVDKAIASMDYATPPEFAAALDHPSLDPPGDSEPLSAVDTREPLPELTPRSDAERDLLGRDVSNVVQVSGDDEAPRYAVEFADGGQGIYLPEQLTPVAMYRLSEAVQADVVPATAVWDGPAGPGALQVDPVDATGPRYVDEYEPVGQDMVRIIDYAGANVRGRDEILTGADGHPVSVHNVNAFQPEGTAMSSGFISENVGTALEPEALGRVRAVDLDELADSLSEVVDPDRVAGTIARLGEMADTGTITGAAWGGTVGDDRGHVVLG